MRKLGYLIPLIILALVLSACSIERPITSTDKNNQNSSTPAAYLSPSSPIRVNLSISKLPLLNETVDLTCNVSSLHDAPNSSAQIVLSKGISLVNGDLQWHGDLGANVTVSLSVQVFFKETGHQTIEANARYVVDKNNSWGDMDVIYLDIGTERSTFGWPVMPAPVVRVDKYGVIKTDLEISHAPKLNEPAKLYITTISPVDFPGLSIGILVSPKTAIVSDTDSKLTVVPLVPGANQIAMRLSGVDLKANVPFHFSAIVVFQDNGYYHVTADAQQKVDSVTYHGLQDTIYLKIGAKESSFEQEPPPTTSSTDLSPPPAIRP